jgi:hypothetical protein
VSLRGDSSACSPAPANRRRLVAKSIDARLWIGGFGGCGEEGEGGMSGIDYCWNIWYSVNLTHLMAPRSRVRQIVCVFRLKIRIPLKSEQQTHVPS